MLKATCGSTRATMTRMRFRRRRPKSRLPEIMRKAGPPTLALLYRGREKWRYAIYTEHGGVADGYIGEVPLAAPWEAAGERLELKVSAWARELHGVDVEIEWSPADEPDWWTGEVTIAGQPETLCHHGDLEG